MITKNKGRQNKYGESFKKSILKKILTGDRTLSSLCKEHGFHASTYYYWVKQDLLKSGQQMKNKKSKSWNISEKLNAIKVTASMSDEEKARWCRENGIYVHMIGEWEKEIIEGKTSPSTGEKRTNRHNLNKLKAENISLRKDLNRKDKALAETAARLILKKKLEEFLGEEEE